MIEYKTLLQPLFFKAKTYALDMQFSLSSVESKSTKDLVTEVDLHIDQLFVAFLQEHFPEDSLLTEEGGLIKGSSNRTWVLDPLDGTINYSRGLPLWGISLALMEDGLPIASWISLPAFDEFYVAEKGKGAFCNDQRIKVSDTKDIDKALISNGDYNVGDKQANQRNASLMKQQADVAMRVKCMGSAVLEGCWVASGKLDAYCLQYCHPWDVAGTALLVLEAGGDVTHLDGPLFEITDECSLLQSNGILHQSFLKALDI